MIFKSLIISFSMYSIIPMPRTDWQSEDMKYTFCFFPFIGAIIGLLSYSWYLLASFLGLNNVFMIVIMLLIPIILSGGIHLDGLIDTCDAIFSYGDREKKIEILKDPRTGAFGVIGCAVYFISLLGILSQLIETPKYILLILTPYFISRSVGALALLTIKKAKSSGLASTFSQATEKPVNIIVLISYLIIIMVFTALTSLGVFLAVLVVLSLFIGLYIRRIKKDFAGITGDLTGFLIMMTELLILLVIAIAGKFGG